MSDICFFRVSFRYLTILGMSVMLAPPMSGKSAKEVTSRAAEDRGFRLFMGIDVKVLNGDEFTSVKDFEGGFTILDEPSRPRIYKDEIRGVDYDHVTRLARHAVVFADLRTSQTRGLDYEALMWMNRQNQMQMLNSLQVDDMQAQINAAHQNPSVQADLAPGEIKPEVKAAQDSMDQFNLSQGQMVDGTFYADRISGEAVEKPNAVQINMNVSSPVPVTGTYLACITRISTEREGFSDRLFFYDLGDIGPEPRAVQILEDGFPEGYHLKSVQMHLFKNGRELATSESDKQFALTREELLEYVVLERVSMHKGETLPPAPIWSLAPASLWDAPVNADWDYPVIVEIGTKGAVSFFDDKQVIPGHIRAIVEELVFMPALETGVPVSAKTTVNLQDFFNG